MKCPDQETLLRILHGDEPEGADALRSHIRGCKSCREKAGNEKALSSLMSEIFGRASESIIRDAGSCPTPEEIALYAEGAVPLYRKAELVRHFCACPVCSRAVLDVHAAGKASPNPPPLSLIREAGAIYRNKEKKSKKPE